uniref:AlNc14C34G3061 protein n=1 Tax=Albugo laibachii Nc14 TaxID=890382 RepID=F0W8D0_9STRA|nr:AlNc14C34G3061 [Albugo laibachii Nc14]|eukprot:CCA17385.1 AlNc14C34G3061 [Albugo laibachii Nc14]
MNPSTKTDTNDERVGKRIQTDPEYAVISAFLSTIDQSSIGDVEDAAVCENVKALDQKILLAQHLSEEREHYLDDENLICRNEILKGSLTNRFGVNNSHWQSYTTAQVSSFTPHTHEESIPSTIHMTTAHKQIRYGTTLPHNDPPYFSKPNTKEEFTFSVDSGSQLTSPKSENELKGSFCPISRHTKLTEMEHYVRELERDNLHLKQSLLLGKETNRVIKTLQSKEKSDHFFKERISIVENMVSN